MRKWLFFLLVIGIVYFLSRLNPGKKDRSPVSKRLNEALSILVWVLFFFYAITFLYWLYTQIFK